MAIYLYEVFLLSEKDPRVIQAENLDNARIEARSQFQGSVRHVRLAREWFNDEPVAAGMTEYFLSHPFGVDLP